MYLKKRSAYFWLVAIPFVLLVAFRGATPDTQIYYNVFLSIRNYNILNPIIFYAQTGMEIGYGWYSYLLSFFTSNNVIVFGLFSLLVFYVIKKSSDIVGVNSLYVLLIYSSSSFFYMQQFMQMRQGLSISICFLALVMLMKKRLGLISLVLLFVSFSLHQTSFPLFLLSFFYMLFIFDKKIKYRSFILYMSLISIIYSLSAKFILLDLISSFSTRMASYRASDNFGESVSLFSLPLLENLIILFLALCLANDCLKQNPFFRFLLFLSFVSISTRVGFSDVAIMSGRLSTVFSYAQVFLLPMVVCSRFSYLSRFIVLFSFFIFHSFVVLKFQAPYLFDMYLTPLTR